MDFYTILWAFLLTLLAGLSTGIGSSIALLVKRPKMAYLALALGFSAGVMMFVSFIELLPHAILHAGTTLAFLAFFFGILIIAAIDMLIPDIKNPHHFKEMPGAPESVGNGHLMRAGMLLAVVIAIHNFPEGIATFGASLENLRLGAVVALAIALHNIPEGISVSVPIFYATGDRKKAFYYSFASGLAEPLGALICLLVLMPFISVWLLAMLLAFVAGIMVYISLDELLPLAHKYGQSHVVIGGIILGMLMMAVSMLIT